MQKHKTDDRLELAVEFKATDDEEQVATGVVMVSDKVDLHGDYVRADTIREFAEQFANFVDVGEGGGGVMHAVWPDDHMALESNEVTDAERDIGGMTVPADSWVQEWHFADDELWSLVSDGILGGYSIGAVNVEWSMGVPQDDLPDDVDVAEDYPDDQPAWELLSGLIREVSAVDLPAVPDALILETKGESAEAMKRLSEHIGDRDGFIAEAMERGHTESEAERLWSYHHRATDIEGAGEPGTSKGMLTRAGRAFLDALTPGSVVDEKARISKTSEEDPRDTDKESRTLSAANRERLMAAHDAVEDALSSDMQFVGNRFTDNPAVDFDVADYPSTENANESAVDEPAESGADADTDTKDKTMSDDDPLADAPEWAKAMHEDIEENSNAVEELGEKFAALDTDDEPPEDPEKAWEDAPAWAKDLRGEQQDLAENVTDLRESAGKSQQLSDTTVENGDGEASEKLDALGAMMG